MELLDRLGYASSLAEGGPRSRAAGSAGRRSLVGARRGPAASARMTLRRRLRPRDRGSRGIGKAIALRFAALGARRVAIGYMRGDTAAEETAAELRSSAPSRCSSAETSRRSGSPRRSPHSAPSTPSSTRRRPASSAPRSRPRTSTGTGRSPRMHARSSRSPAPRRRRCRRARRSSGSPASARPACSRTTARRRVEGRARGARPLPRGRARAAGDPRERGLGGSGRDRRARALPEPARRCSRWAGGTRRAGSSRPRTSPPA